MKLVVWDLDETLWEGKLMYGNVKLKDETKEVFKQLNKLKIKQCICSKNNLKDAIKKLDEFGLTKYLSDIVANWSPKSENIKNMLIVEDVKPEETLFVDDEKINRAEVKEVIGCHVDYDTDLFNIMKYFDTDRLLLMKQERQRHTAEKEYKGTFKDFIENSGMVFEIRPGHVGMLTRITNLANRTNELNASRNRYSEEQIKEMLENHEFYQTYVINLKDNYGDYGIIGEVIIEKLKSTWYIKDICISCRVMGRGIGTRLLQHVISTAKQRKIYNIIGLVVLSEENFRMPELYEKLGFINTSEKKNIKWYELKL